MYKLFTNSLLLVVVVLSGCSDDINRDLPPSNGFSPGVVLPSPPPPAPPPPPPPPPPAPMPAADVSGTWFSRTINNAVNCGLGVVVDAQTNVISQNGNDIMIMTSAGNELEGIVSGDIVEWQGEYADRGGMMTFTSASLTVSGNTSSGNAAWTWTDGTDSCNGTMEMSASLDWGVDESMHNSRPDIADPVTFTDSVAYFNGMVLAADDSDYFLIVPDSDSILQAELSHFDILTNNLDLEVLDENLDQIAISNTVDAFEIVSVQLSAGESYYVVVTPIVSPGNSPYQLSLDLNQE